MGGVENPGHAGEIAVGGGNGEGKDVGDEGVNVEEFVEDEVEDPVNGSVDDADDDEFGELLEDGGVGFKMEQAAAPEDEAVNPVGVGRGGAARGLGAGVRGLGAGRVGCGGFGGPGGLNYFRIGHKLIIAQAGRPD